MDGNLTLKLKEYDDHSSAIIKRIQSKLESSSSNAISKLSIPDIDLKNIERMRIEIQNMQKTTYDLIEEEVDTVDGIFNEMMRYKAEIKGGLNNLAKKVGKSDQNFANALKTYFIHDTHQKPQVSEIDIQSVISKGDYLNKLHAKNFNQTDGTSIFGTGRSNPSAPFNVFQPKQIEGIFKRYKEKKLNDSDMENYTSSQKNIFNGTGNLVELKKANQKLNKRSQSGHVNTQEYETPVFRKTDFGSKISEIPKFPATKTPTNQSINFINKLASQTQNIANRYVVLEGNPSFSDRKQWPEVTKESRNAPIEQSEKKPQSINYSMKYQTQRSNMKLQSREFVKSSAKQDSFKVDFVIQSKKIEKPANSLKYCLNNDSEDEDEEIPQTTNIKDVKQPYNVKVQQSNTKLKESPKIQKKQEPRDSISEALDFSYKRREADKNMNSVEFNTFDDDDFDDL